MTNHCVSVVVPTYNRAYCLARTVDSALAQTHRSLEVLIVDDGSKDETAEMVRERYGSEPRVRYLPKKNGGVSSARNYGLDQAQGDYVALLDSDDVWVPWKLELQLAALRRCPEAGMIWTDMVAVDPSDAVVSPAFLRTMYHAWRRFTVADLFPQTWTAAELAPSLAAEVGDTKVYAGDVYSQMVMGSLVHTSTVLITRERLERVGRFNENWPGGEDYDFHLRTCREGAVAFVDLPTIRYQVGMGDTVSHRQYLHIATNCLNTVQAALDRDKDRITLPQTMLRERFAHIHQWIGEANLEGGQISTARRHFLASLRYQPWQPRTAAQLAQASMPGALGPAAKRVYRGLKARFAS